MNKDSVAEHVETFRLSPTRYIVISLFAGSAAFGVSTWYYSGQLSTKDAYIEYLKAQLMEYKNKLNVTTPDEAKQRLEAVESNSKAMKELLSKALIFKEYDKLTDAQIEVLKNAFSKGNLQNLAVVYISNDPSSVLLAHQIYFMLEKINLSNQLDSQPIGEITERNLGIQLLIKDPQKNAPKYKMITEAFSSIGLTLKFEDGWRSGPAVLYVAPQGLVR